MIISMIFIITIIPDMFYHGRHGRDTARSQELALTSALEASVVYDFAARCENQTMDSQIFKEL